ncbi:7-cyano-7-deazaguanine synthase, partial [Bienertia sinuspersici]
MSLVNSIQHDTAIRNVVYSTYKELNVKVSSLIGKVNESITLENVENKPKSTLEKQCNELKGHIKAWKNRAEKALINTRATALVSVK